MVNIVIGNVYSKISGFLSDEIQKQLYESLSYKIANAQHIPKVKKKQWDGVIRLYKQNHGQSFYTGLMSLVREVLKKNKIHYEITDRRVLPAQNMPDLVFSPPAFYEPREYQDFTVNRALKFTRGVLSVCTGGGKTMITSRLISEIKTYPFIFYVLTKDLMEQAHEVLSSSLNYPIGVIGDGKCDIKKITVCTVQTVVSALHSEDRNFNISDYFYDDEDKWDEKGIENEEKASKIRKLVELARGLYMDECHHTAAKTCTEVLRASPHSYWRYGGSATPYRDNGDEMMIQALFGAKIVDISASYLIKNNFLVKPRIFFVPIRSGIKAKSYAKIYKDSIVDNIDYNKHVADTANHLVKRNLSVLVLVKQYKQGNTLKKLIPNSVFVTGKLTTAKRTEHINDLRERKLNVMIATSLADEGLDIPTLDAVIIAGGGKSSTRLHQRIGRTLRQDKEGKKNKSIIIIYDHYDSKYLRQHFIKTASLLKKEKEFVIKKSKGELFIFKEIDDFLGVKSESVGLFE